MNETFPEPVEKRLVSRVVSRVVQDLRRGAWRPTEKLPSEREFAVSLQVSRNTVTAAYGIRAPGDHSAAARQGCFCVRIAGF